METPPNPYAPPQSPVSDPATPSIGACPHVELACRLLWISFAFSLLDNVVKIFEAPTVAEKVGGIIGNLIGLGIGCALLIWITRKLRAGRNWMRWLYTTVNVLSWLSIAVFWDFYRKAFQMILTGWLPILSLALQTIAGLAVLVLLHTLTTREWFRAQKAAAN